MEGKGEAMIFVVGGAFQGKGKAAASLAAETIGTSGEILRADAGEIGLAQLEARAFDVLEHVHLLVREELCRRMEQDDSSAWDTDQKAAAEAADSAEVSPAVAVSAAVAVAPVAAAQVEVGKEEICKI